MVVGKPSCTFGLVLWIALTGWGDSSRASAQDANDWNTQQPGKVTYSAGDVAIGLTNPRARLHVQGALWPADGSALTVHGYDRRGGSNAVFKLTNQKSWTNTLFYLRQQADDPKADILRADDLAGDTVFTLKQRGWVGIGTATPIQALDVAGRLHVADGVIQRGGQAISGTSDLGLYSQVQHAWIRLVSRNAPIRFFTDGGVGTTPRLSIEADGRVGIGTLDTTGVRLAVGGNVRAGKLALTGGEIKLSTGNGVQKGLIRSPAAGGLHLSSGDAHADLAIAQNGFVGLGTTRPASRLHISGGGDSVELLLEADTDNIGEEDQPRLTLRQDGGQVRGQLQFVAGRDDLELVNHKGGARIILLSNGDVCLGTGC